ncbi:MAG: branched-chain amino acid transaminase [Bryobacterales bacterium]|nr:branched-chain amino acid transaminase [Bryobacterales bacterium]
MSHENVTVFFDGRFVPLREANVNILTHALNYGTGVFEGIRGYWCPRQEELYLFRLEDHYRRWKTNARIFHMDITQTVAELCDITLEAVRRNHFQTDIYVRPLVYMSSARVGVHPDGNFSFAIVAVPFGVYIDSRQGLHAGVVSWRRIEDAAIPSRAKVCGAYVNSVLATSEAHRHHYDEAIMLNESGHVAEGATCNLFIVRNGKLITPSVNENILEGITRQCVIDLARRELHLEAVERPIDRTELYTCDEAFFTGTAVEVAPIVKIDHRPIGDERIGPITAHLRQLYADAAHGRMTEYFHWLTHTYQPALTPVDR